AKNVFGDPQTVNRRTPNVPPTRIASSVRVNPHIGAGGLAANGESPGDLRPQPGQDWVAWDVTLRFHRQRESLWVLGLICQVQRFQQGLISRPPDFGVAIGGPGRDAENACERHNGGSYDGPAGPRGHPRPG